MPAYYNEIDAFAAQWLRNLIAAGHIAPGEVDTRSIVEVQGDDLRGFKQCHFFAGIGGWSLAFRLSGWRDEAVGWTGSCPCQPLSSAGQRKGHADERHLWPAFHRLIAECAPPIVFGEQVASKDGREWLAGIRADLEALGYACGAADLCAAGVGAPHIRQRIFWVADAVGGGVCGRGHGAVGSAARGGEKEERQRQWVRADAGADGGAGVQGLADADGASEWRGELGQQPQNAGASRVAKSSGGGWRQGRASEASNGRGHPLCAPDGSGLAAGLGHAASPGREEQRRQHSEGGEGRGGQPRPPVQNGIPQWNGATIAVERADGWARIAAQPALFPVAARLPGDVGRLRGSGNAIVPQVAAEFVSAFMECRP